MILLIAAETANEPGMADKALGYVNQVRARARGGQVRASRPIWSPPTGKRYGRPSGGSGGWSLGWSKRGGSTQCVPGAPPGVTRALGKDFEEGKHELSPIPQGDIDLSLGVLPPEPRLRSVG